MQFKKLRREAIGLAVFSFACLVMNIGGCAFLYHKSKTLEETIPVIKGIQAVPLHIYKNSLAFSQLLESTVLPAMSCGYLLLGLYILRYCQRLNAAKANEFAP